MHAMIHHLRPSSNASPLTIATTFLVTLIPLYLFSYHYRTQHPYGGSQQLDVPAAAATTTLSPAEFFMQTWLSTHLIDPFDPAPISAYCNLTTWRPSLVFSLANANGGIGNIRGNFLDFIFTAIEMGASIILPGMAARDTNNLSNVWGGRMGFHDMFDEDWFVATMRSACPGMEVYKFEEGMEMVEAVEGIWRSRSRRLDENFDNTLGAGLESLESWLEGNEDFKERYGNGSGIGEDEPILVNLERTLWDVDTRSLHARGLRRNFGQLLKIAPVYRGMAALVIWRLVEKFGLSFESAEAVPKNGFYGAHLRTADDAKNAGWLAGEGMNASAQMDGYLAHAKEFDLHVIYVASGNAEDIKLFQKKAVAQKPPMVVVSKFDLLPAHEAATLHAMTWDQQGLVDWEVLKRCSIFGGIVKSSFAFNIAMTRYQYLEDRGMVGDPWAVQHSEVNTAFEDGISRIFGRDAFHEQRIPRGMWP